MYRFYRRLLPCLALLCLVQPVRAQAPDATLGLAFDEVGAGVAVYGYEVTLDRDDSPPVIALVVRTKAPRSELDFPPSGDEWTTVSPEQASFLTDLVEIPENPAEMEPRSDLVGWASTRAPRLTMTTEDRFRFRVQSRDWFPGLTDAWLVGRPEEGLELTPGRPLEGAQLTEVAVGPVVPSTSVEDAHGTLAQLQVQQARACRLGWIRTDERCADLGRTVGRMERSLEAGDAEGFQGAGQILLEQLEPAVAGEDAAVEPMAARLLLFYLDRLGKQASDVLTRG